MVMWIYKRDGRKEPVAFDKVTARVRRVAPELGCCPSYLPMLTFLL
jgi:hypothetical protein